MITKFSDLDLNATYSYADYLQWKFSERVELIKGRIFKMSPAPSVKHQRVSGIVYGTLYTYFKGKTCRAFHAPFDVVLYDSRKAKKGYKNVFTVVQPDICVICDPKKLGEQSCNGAPDWIIEILSPGTAKRDLVEKYKLYEENEVKEYWIVYPHEHHIVRYILEDNGKYGAPTYYTEYELAKPALFPDLDMDLAEIFELPPPREEEEEDRSLI
jgi:Uma2 family endonuclease